MWLTLHDRGVIVRHTGFNPLPQFQADVCGYPLSPIQSVTPVIELDWTMFDTGIDIKVIGGYKELLDVPC